MPEDKSEIPQIKPQSILDPPNLDSKEPAATVKDSVDIEIPEIKIDETAETTKTTMKTEEKKHKKRNSRRKKIILGVLASIAVIAVFVIVFIVLPGLSLYKNALKLKDRAYAMKDSANSQDISVVKGELNNFKVDFEEFKNSYAKFSWVRGLPFVGAYWRDGDSGLKAATHAMEAGDIIIETAEPYADIIGFAGPNSKQAANAEDTANDRIEFLIQTIDDILPKIDEISAKAKLVEEEISTIDPDRYPEEFRGIKIRENLKQGIALVGEAASLLSESKPLLESAPYLLGINEPRTYLLLFQNDKELRPTGGFITAYSIVKVINGKLQPVSSSDIYNLDANYKPTVPAPDPIIDYLKGPYTLSKNYRLRDMNWSPDFRDSIELFMQEAETAGIDQVDGVIAVDTQVVVNVLDVLGQIGVPGFGDFSTNNDPRCDCPQVIYELESFADVEGPVVWSQDEPDKIIFAPANYDNRKKIVGPLLNSVLSNALGQSKEKLPSLMEAGWKSVLEKHVMVYFFDENAQEGAEGFNIAGRIKNYEGDYLHISDANLGGRKSNLYVNQEVAQEIEVQKDGSIVKTLTITYKNPQSYDGWLNSVLPNWTRVYVPEGAELISTEGFENDGGTYTELGKTVFAGGFELRPEGVKKITLKYKLPFKAQGEYKLLVQKQPGTDAPLYSIKIGKKEEEMFLRTDHEFKFKI